MSEDSGEGGIPGAPPLCETWGEEEGEEEHGSGRRREKGLVHVERVDGGGDEYAGGREERGRKDGKSGKGQLC